MLVQLKNITKNYGKFPVFERINLQINEGEKIGFVGNNGSGKSTLLTIISGIETSDNGTISRKRNSKIGYLEQMHHSNKQNVRVYLMDSFTELSQLQKQLRQLEQWMSDPEKDLDHVMTLYGKTEEAFQQAGGYTIENRLDQIVNGLKITYLLEAIFDELSGGEKTLVNLARILIQKSDLILLDEPTNHLDTSRIEWLEGYLKHEKVACLIISHDRLFLDNVVEKVIELDCGELLAYQGNYSSYKMQKERAIERLQKNYLNQQKEIKKMKGTIRRLRQWGNEGDNENFFKKAKELEKRLEKIQQIPQPKTDKNRMKGLFKEVKRSGKEVIHFEEVGHCFAQRELFENVSFSVFWQDRIAIIGKNGVGKSTLLKMILGKIEPAKGKIKRGTQLRIGYLPQLIHYNIPTRTVLQEVISSCSLTEQESYHLLANYGFFKEEVKRQVRFLSGGERVRLELAKLMQQEINLLLLDEPTNHLDIQAREEIEDILSMYTGTLIVVSHDRFFLKKMVSNYLVLDGKIR